MKKLRIAVAALVIAAGSFAAFAFTNTNNSENEKAEFLNVYHYVGEDEDGDIIFASGEPAPNACQPTGEKPCRFTSTQTLTSPMSQDDIESQADVTAWRN